MTDNSIPHKTCTKCGRMLPATVENFKRMKGGKYGFRGTCRDCYNAYRRDYDRRNPDKKKAMRRRDYERHADRYKAQSKAWHEANPERSRALALERGRRYSKRHPERKIAQVRDYERRNPEKVRVMKQTVAARYKARKRQRPDEYTNNEWLACLEYFNHTCAYCGSQQSFWFRLEMEHYIPISEPDCPGTVAANIIPACKHCNASKQDKSPEAWLIEHFSKRKAKRIIKRIQDYFTNLECKE